MRAPLNTSMKIDLTNIPTEGKRLDFHVPPEWWKPEGEDDRIVGLASPLSAPIKVYPTGKKIMVDGHLSTTLLLRCDRCLEPYTWDLSTEFRISLSLSPFRGEGEIELLEDDLNIDFIEGNLLDANQIIREQLILNVPMKTICTAECKGLCPICGCNLNTTHCSCSSDYKISLQQE
jgi:uncharacterized protein